MENGPFEDVFPTQNGQIPASYVSLPECIQVELVIYNPYKSFPSAPSLLLWEYFGQVFKV